MERKSNEQMVAQDLTGPSYSDSYLKQYWPEHAGDPDAWADNAVLMLAYQDAALAVSRHFQGRAVKMLDVSTGPALAPVMAMLTCISEAQLSDFHSVNRDALKHMPIEYWQAYVPMLIKIFDAPEQRVKEILLRLDQLRSQHPPVEVDLFSENPFPASIKASDFELLSMQFVADGITETEAEFLRCLGKVTDMLKPGAAFIMSATVDCKNWQRGDSQEPSPNVSEKTICDFLESQGLRMISRSRSMRLPALTYSGGWTVLAAVRPF